MLVQHMRHGARLAVLLACAALTTPTKPARAQDSWTFEGFLGAAYNFDSPLTVRQRNFPALELDARYDTRAFEPPLYYALRVSHWSQDRGWDVELIHHKLYLRDPPPEIEAFAVSHGNNLLLAGRVWSRSALISRIGIGAAIAHPENTVRGRTLSEERGFLGTGYYLAGPAVTASIGAELPTRTRWFLSVGLKGSYSWARVPVADGRADVQNVAIHGLIGGGYRSSAGR